LENLNKYVNILHYVKTLHLVLCFVHSIFEASLAKKDT